MMRRPSRNFLSLFKKLILLSTVVVLCKFFLTPMIFDDNLPLPLQDIMNHTIGNDNIFFIETSGAVRIKSGTLNSRQACSVESAAIKNPTSGIYLVFVDVEEVEASNVIKSLRKYRNIHFLRLRLNKFSLNTPVDSFIKSRKIGEGYVMENVSDLLRVLILWK